MRVQEATEAEGKLLLLQNRLSYMRSMWSEEHYLATLDMCARCLPILVDAGCCRVYLSKPQPLQVFSDGQNIEQVHQIMPSNEHCVLVQSMTTGKSNLVNDLSAEQCVDLSQLPSLVTSVANTACVPVRSVLSPETVSPETVIGALQVFNKSKSHGFTKVDIELLEDMARSIAMTCENLIISEDVMNLSSNVGADFRANHTQRVNNVSFYAESDGMRSLTDQVDQLSKLPVNLHIHGENGTGKELIARMIHEGSDRASDAFVAVNCAAIPADLVESEFFGYEKGAFTGANTSRGGLLEEARGGTLFLDEVAEMPLPMQAKLLRVLQESEGTRLGSSRIIKYDFRLVSATNRDLKEEIGKQSFREDLYYRLFSVELRIPPLRERREDIILMAVSFLNEISAKFNKQIAGFSPNTLRLFERYPWPGNVRQFRHEIERLVALTPEGQYIMPELCSPEIYSYARQNQRSAEPSDQSELALPHAVTCLEIRLIEKALKATDGNKMQAAKLLNITRQGLYKKMVRYQID